MNSAPSHPLFRKVCRASLIAALCFSIGGHWIALQSLAWASMLVQNSTRAPFSEAILRTFDGQHPCNLCKGIAAAQQSQKKPAQAQASAVKQDFICAARVLPFVHAFQEIIFSRSAHSFSVRALSPPVPPPRVTLA